MATNQSFQDAYNEYLIALNKLYARPSTTGRTEAQEQDYIAGASDALVARSKALREVLSNDIATMTMGQRELDGLKLLAAAMYDLAAASDLMQVKQEGPNSLVERKASGVALGSDQLRNILEASQEKGIAALRTVESESLPNDAAAAKEQLEKRVELYLKQIPKETAEICGLIVTDLGKLKPENSTPSTDNLKEQLPGSLPPASRAAANLLLEATQKLHAAIGEAEGSTQEQSASQEQSSTGGLFSMLPDTISPYARGLAGIISGAVDTLRSVVGQGQAQEDPVYEQIVGWLDEFQKRPGSLPAYLEELYNMQQIRADFYALLQNLPGNTPSAEYNRMTRSLDDLRERFNLTKGVIFQCLQILKSLKPALEQDKQWGRGTYYLLSLGLLGYAVYSGGDYLDWKRLDQTRWMKRVAGPQTIFKQQFGEGNEALNRERQQTGRQQQSKQQTS